MDILNYLKENRGYIKEEVKIWHCRNWHRQKWFHLTANFRPNAETRFDEITRKQLLRAHIDFLLLSSRISIFVFWNYIQRHIFPHSSRHPSHRQLRNRGKKTRSTCKFTFSKNYMLPVKPRSRRNSDEKLRAVRVWASISHWKDTSRVRDVEALIFKASPVDWVAAWSVVSRKIAALDHEFLYNSVKSRPSDKNMIKNVLTKNHRVHLPLVFSISWITHGKCTKVLCSLWNCVSKEPYFDVSNKVVGMVDSEGDFISDL